MNTPQRDHSDLEKFVSLFHDYSLTLLHSERPKLYTISVFLSAIGLKNGKKIAVSVYSIIEKNLPPMTTIRRGKRFAVSDCF